MQRTCWQDHPGSTAVLVFPRATTNATSYYKGKRLSVLPLTGCILAVYYYITICICLYNSNLYAGIIIIEVINTVLLFYSYHHHSTDAFKDG